MKSRWIVDLKFDNENEDEEIFIDGNWVPLKRNGYVFWC